VVVTGGCGCHHSEKEINTFCGECGHLCHAAHTYLPRAYT
jgi:hypothetical protein